MTISSVLCLLSKSFPLASLMAVVLLGGAALPAAAQGFGASISPPRFELQLKAGQTQREVIEIQQSSGQGGAFKLYTNDWSFHTDGSVVFSNDLAPDSCRPWVALERRDLTVAANGRYRYRFQISPPAGTPPRECRFAIMIEGTDPTRVEQGGLNIPVGGRIAVIVYAAIDGAAPKLDITEFKVNKVDGKALPVLEVRNTGNAHGRFDGFLSGKDAAGVSFELSPADVPILPGDTRSVKIYPVTDDPKGAPPITYPITVKGTIEWGKNKLPLEHVFTQ